MSKKLLVLFRVYPFGFVIFLSFFGRKDSGNLSPTPLPDSWKGTVRFSGHKQVAKKVTKTKTKTKNKQNKTKQNKKNNNKKQNVQNVIDIHKNS